VLIAVAGGLILLALGLQKLLKRREDRPA
jgi:hypothetical protein